MILTAKKFLCCLACLLFVPLPVRAGQSGMQSIVIWEHLWFDRYRIEILLDHTVDDFGPYELVKSAPMEQGRALHEVEIGREVNLLWLPCSLEREQRLLPVYIYMGGRTMGYRVCMIRRGTQHLFDDITSLSDWHDSAMVMGTGTHWADTQILEHNNIAVSKNTIYENLYKQLHGGRFHAFPRGIDQIKGKMDIFGPDGLGLNLAVERRLLFVYPFREIIFLNKRATALKERLETGYQRALADGTWQASFHREAENEFGWLKLNQRVLIPLVNPFLSEKVLSMPIFDADPLKNGKDSNGNRPPK